MQEGLWLDERYRILRMLGKGGQGSVYLAVQERTYKFYAVKVVEKEQDGFSVESVEVWKRLSHPGLPEIVDIVETEREICLIMDYVEGKTLEEIRKEAGRLHMREVLFWGIQICEILEYLHGQEPPIVFGDIKLSNLILQGNRIVMVDLGSAMFRNSKGRISGTMEYLPEDQTLWCADPKRDVFALGKCLDKLLIHSGRRGVELEKILKKCTSPEQQNGYQTIRSCRQDLERLQQRPWILTVMMLIVFGIMMLAADVMKKERLEADVSFQYEQVMAEAANSTMEQQRELLEAAVEIDPSCETGYLELLENLLEDSKWSEEEEVRMRKLLLRSGGDGICFEDKLRENERGYAEVAWQMAMAYWYFYQGEGGKKYASQWFEKLLEMSEEAIEEKKKEQSRIYAEIGSYRLALEHGDLTGESEVDFVRYWRDLQELFELTMDEEENESLVTRLYFWQEFLTQMLHYQLEFVQAGVEEEEMKRVCKQIESAVEKMKDSNKVVLQKKKEIEAFLKNVWEEWQ